MAKAKAAALFAAMSFVSAMGQSSGAAGDDLMKDVAHLKDFQAIELRRYTIKEGVARLLRGISMATFRRRFSN
jgi:hypothetical protein